MEYAIYVRKSSDESSEKQVQSIPDQIEKVIEYAEKQELTIMKKPDDFSDFETEEEIIKEDNTADLYNRRVFRDNRKYFIIKESKSAKVIGKRPKRKKLVEWIKKWKIKWLISYSPDRQARNMVDWWLVIELADQWLVDLKYKTFYFENNADGRMMLWFLFVFSKHYSDKLGTDIGRGNEQAVKKWKSLWDYKYWYVRREDGLFEPHPIYFDLMKQAFHMKVHEQKSNQYIADWLNNEWFVREYKNWRVGKLNGRYLWPVRRNPFYYWVYIAWKSTIDYREEWTNPHFAPMITSQEYEVLNERLERRTPSKQKRKKEYTSVIPYRPWTVITEDKYNLTPYLPNPHRFEKRLKKAKLENAKLTYWDIVQRKQIRCKYWGSKGTYKVDISYEDIHSKLTELFSTVVVNDAMYQRYLRSTLKRFSKEANETTKELQRLTLRLNNIRADKQSYMEKNLWEVRDKEEEQIYQRQKQEFASQIEYIENRKKELLNSERNKEMELELFMTLLKKLPQLFGKATYVQQAIITRIFISNIVVTAEKAVIITVKEKLQPLFNGYVEINTNLLHPLQSSLMKNQYIYSRINSLLRERGYSTIIS